MSAPISVLVVEAQTLVREGLLCLLDAPGLAPAGGVGTLAAARAAVHGSQPRVVVLDLDMPGDVFGFLTACAREAECPPAVVGLTGCRGEGGVLLALERGVRGYLLRPVATGAHLRAAVAAAAAGRIWVQPELVSDAVAGALAARTGAGRFSEREIQFLALLARGCRNGQIAAAMFVSEKTVRNCMTRLFAKLGVRNRAEAVQRARTLDLV